MEKTFLEQAIQKKAEERFEKHYKEFRTSLRENPIARNLKINIKGIAEPVPMYSQYVTEGLLQGNSSNLDSMKETIKAFHNFKELREELIEEFKEEETKNLLSRLESIQYLLNNQ